MHHAFPDKKVLESLLLQNHAWYQSPRDEQAMLVAYRAGEKGDKRKVGFGYINFSVIDRKPSLLRLFAQNLATQVLEHLGKVDAIMAVPYGGLNLAHSLAAECNNRAQGCQSLFLERTGPGREFRAGRYVPDLGAHVVLCEDTTSTLESLRAACECLEGFLVRVVGVACAVNRSGQQFLNHGRHKIPLFSAADIEIQQYEQDDPEVAELVRLGRVQWNPKQHQDWQLLMKIMHG